MIFESTKSNVYTLFLNEIIIYSLKKKMNNFVYSLVWFLVFESQASSNFNCKSASPEYSVWFASCNRL